MMKMDQPCEGLVVSIGDWHDTDKGDRIRDYWVDVEGNRTQHYVFTEHCKKNTPPKALIIGEVYKFFGFMNGMKIMTSAGCVRLNKILITEVCKPV